MIRYALSCDNDHRFESWFQSADAYDTLHRAGHLACAVCGSSGVSKAIMAPAVSTSEIAVRAPKTPLEQLRAKVEAESDYVGLQFAAEARAIHDGTAPERAIYGEARADEARKLLEDGIPVMPLPFIPTKRTN